MRSAALLHGLCLCALLPTAVAAQAVRGRVVDADAGQPAIGAIVTLMSADERRLAPTLVGDDGRYVVAAPSAGTYLIRVELIGYRTWQSPPIAVPARDTVSLDVRLPLRRVQLEAVRIQGETPCETRPDQQPRIVALWDEIRRALTISDITTRQGLLPLGLTVVDERRSNSVVTSRSVQHVRANGARPWATRSPAELAKRGFFVRDDESYEYIGPDVPILLSPEFLATHCFRPVRRRSLLRRTREIGLEFAPSPGRRLPDVKGTIWLDERSSELRRVEFSYVNLPDESASAGDPRGRLEFGRQPNGTWFVREWEMIRNVMQLQRQYYGASASGPGTVTSYYEHRTRGEAAPLGSRSSRRSAVLQGMVVDSTVGEALAGAVVDVPGVEPVRTDSLGRFAVLVTGMPEDSMDAVISVAHPRLGILGLASVEQTVRLRTERPTTVQVAIPPVATLLSFFCPFDGRARRDERGALRVGMIVGRATWPDGTPLPAGSRIIAEWPSDERLGQSIASRTEQRAVAPAEDGQFRLCPVPVGRALQLRVEVDRVTGEPMEFLLPALGIGQVDLIGGRRP